jgi:hypothetical protein
MNIFRHIARWTALLLLVNIGLGFCDCLREPVSIGGVATHAHATAPSTNGQSAPDCGDNCESCVCHANLVVAEPVRFTVTLAVSGAPATPPLAASDPTRIGITHPPRA